MKNMSTKYSGTANVPFENLLRRMTDEELKQLFEPGDVPTNEDFIAIIDSKINVAEAVEKTWLEHTLEAYFGNSPQIAQDWYNKEMERRASETTRISQESTRQTQEVSRQQSVATMQTNIDNKIVNVEGRMKTIENQFDSMVDGTGFATQTYVDTKVSGVVGAAPDKLNTLKKISDSLGSDANFATTVSNQIGTKADKSYVDTQLGNKSNVGHKHVMSDISGLELSSTSVNRPGGKTVEESIVANESSILLANTKISNLENELLGVSNNVVLSIHEALNVL